MTPANTRLGREGELFWPGSHHFPQGLQDRASDSDRVANRLQGAFTGVEEASIAHRFADSPRLTDEFGVAACRFEDTINPGVKHSDDLC